MNKGEIMKVEIKGIRWNDYIYKHRWVYKRLGVATRCDSLTCNKRSKKYHWANISGEYILDPSDWMQLCASCHLMFDNGNKCTKGHEFTSENTYIRPDNLSRTCKTCQKSYEIKFKEKTLWVS